MLGSFSKKVIRKVERLIHQSWFLVLSIIFLTPMLKASGCGDDPPGLTSILVIYADLFQSTEADLEDLDSIRLDRTLVEVIWSEEKDSHQERVLLDTQNMSSIFPNADVELIVGQFAAPPGYIHQVRFILSDAGCSVSGGSNELEIKTPSGMQTGLKLVPDNNGEPFHTEDNGTTFLRAQFYFDERVVRQGNGRFLLKPTVPTLEFEVAEVGYNPNILWVQFNPGVTRSQVEDINSGHDVTISRAYPSLGNRYRMKLGVEFPIRDAYEYYSDKSEVSHVAPATYGVPDQVNDAEAQDHQRSVNLVDAWNTSFNALQTVGSPSTVIAVTDDGLNIAHVDIALNVWINPGEIPPNIMAEIQDDGDGIITFWDLNAPINSTNPNVAVDDVNGNGFIDGRDLLADALTDLNGDGVCDQLDAPLDTDQYRWVNCFDDDGNLLEDDLVGWDFTGEDNDPSTLIRKADNVKVAAGAHGTKVSGVAVAIGDNDVGGRNAIYNDFGSENGGVAGSCWRCRIMILRVDDLEYFDGSGALKTLAESGYIATAYQYAVRHGAHVINTSKSHLSTVTGTSVPGDPKRTEVKGGEVWKRYKKALDHELIDLATYMNDTGNFALFVISAGNYNLNISEDKYHFWPQEKEHIDILNIGLDPGQTRVLIVGGTNISGTSKWGASNYGDDVHIWAPYPDWKLLWYQSDDLAPANHRSGTSFSAPCVAGTAGLVFSLFPGITPEEVAEAIVNTADLTGDGLPRLDAADAVLYPTP